MSLLTYCMNILMSLMMLSMVFVYGDNEYCQRRACYGSYQ